MDRVRRVTGEHFECMRDTWVRRGICYGLPAGFPMPGILLWSMLGMLGIFFGADFVVAGAGFGLTAAGVAFFAGAAAFAFERADAFAAGVECVAGSPESCAAALAQLDGCSVSSIIRRR